MADIFISYSRKDKDFVTRLREALIALKREVWVDLKDIPPTVEWWQKVTEGIEDANAVVFILSPDFLVSETCQKELAHAVEQHKRLIPVVCREVDAKAVPDALRRLNWLNFREANAFDAGVQTLLEEVDTDHEWVDAHTNLLEKATEWDRKGRGKSLLLRGDELREAQDRQVENAEKEPKFTELMVQFIKDSQQDETDSQKRKNKIYGTGALVFLVISIIAIILYFTGEKRRKIALSRQLAAQSEQLAESRLDLSLLLAAQAVQVEDTTEARYSLSGFTKHPQLLALLHGHKKGEPSYHGVNSVAFSPDGKILASGSNDKTVILWDLEKRQPIGEPLSGHDDRVHTVAFSPDGRTLASASYREDADSYIILWEVEKRQANGAPLIDPILGPFGTDIMVFSPDGKTLLSGSYDEIILWDLEKRQRIGESWSLSNHKMDSVSAISSPDGMVLAQASLDKTIVLWDIKKRQPLGSPLPGHKGFNSIMAFSPDGRTLASGGREIVLWDVEKGYAIGQPLAGFRGFVTRLAFSPDGKTLASGGGEIGESESIILWDVEKMEPIGSPLTGHKGKVETMAFSPDGKTLASGDNDGNVILWDVGRQANGVPSSRHKDHDVQSVAFSPDGKTLASGGGGDFGKPGSIILWDVKKGQSIGPPLTGHKNVVWSVAFSPDGRLLASGSHGEVILWDMEKMLASGAPLIGHKWGCTFSLSFSPDGKTLASGNQDGTIILWDVDKRQANGPPLIEHISDAASVAFSPDGKTLASGGADRTIILWDVLKRQPIGPPLTGHKNWVSSVAFSPDGKTLASGSHDETVILWDVKKKQARGLPLGGHKGYVESVAFSPDGKTLASGSVDGTFILWNVEQGQASSPPLQEGFGPVKSVAFSPPDGKILALGSGSVIFCDVEVKSWLKRACRMANRNLTMEEWRQYMGDLPYRKTCPDLPDAHTLSDKNLVAPVSFSGTLTPGVKPGVTPAAPRGAVTPEPN